MSDMNNISNTGWNTMMMMRRFKFKFIYSYLFIYRAHFKTTTVDQSAVQLKSIKLN